MGVPRKARFNKCYLSKFVCFFHFSAIRILVFVRLLTVYLVKLSWPKTLVKKWFNIKSKAEDFHADDILYEGDNGI